MAAQTQGVPNFRARPAAIDTQKRKRSADDQPANLIDA
jgi:hypothetical protein